MPFQKTKYHISKNGYNIPKHGHHTPKISATHILHILSQKKASIENSKNLGGLRNVSGSSIE